MEKHNSPISIVCCLLFFIVIFSGEAAAQHQVFFIQGDSTLIEVRIGSYDCYYNIVYERFDTLYHFDNTTNGTEACKISVTASNIGDTTYVSWYSSRDSIIIQEGMFVNRMASGLFRTINTYDGTVSYCQFVNGFKEGVQKADPGSRYGSITITTFVKGKRHGIEYRLTYDNMLEYIKEFQNGEVHGRFMAYWVHDLRLQLRFSLDYANGKVIDGQYLSYYSNGNIASKHSYTDGRLNGWSYFYSLTGELMEKVFYKNDKTVKTEQFFK